MNEIERHARLRRRRRAHDDRGAVIIEAAIVLPILFMLVFGILEIGSALKSYSGSANAVRAGGRMASVAGNIADADRAIMERVGAEASGIGAGEIEYIVIWHASAPGTQPPANCLPAAQASPNTSSVGVSDGGPLVDAVGACNVYHRPAATGGAFDMASGRAANPASYYFGCTGASDPTASHKVDCRWAAKNRKTTIIPRGGTPAPGKTGIPDYVGVYIRAQHDWVTGVLSNSPLIITDGSITLIEPQGYSVTG